MLTLAQVLEKHPLPFELEELQKQDIEKAAYWGRCLMDLPVGYGKTVIATCVSLIWEPDTTVVLVPPILIVQWVKWLQSIPGTGTVVGYEGSPAARLLMPVKTANWLVMSYQIFKNDLPRLTKELSKREVMTIVDEGQHIKSTHSKIFKAVQVFSSARNLLVMSGTIMSKPVDAYSYIKLNTPTVYRTLGHFENIHVAERDFFDQPIAWQNMELLRDNLSLRRVYRTKEEVHAALPKARFIPIYYDLSKEHMALYKRLMDEQLFELEASGTKIDATTAQKMYHCAQQIITNFGYFADDETKRAGVFDLVDEVIDEIALGEEGSSKLILWTTYKMTSRRVLDYMQNKGGKAVAAYSEADSKKSVAHFLDDPNTVTLVAQPRSAGAGLNPQHICWECLFIEIPTTTIYFTQSAGRIDRKGQKYRPNIRLAIARGTIQEKLLANLLENDKLVTEASGSMRGLKSMIFPSKTE